MSPPLSIHRVLVVSLFLPYTFSFEIGKEREYTFTHPIDINLTVPKPNLIERLAAKRADGPVTPSQQIEDPINKLFPSKGPTTPPASTGRTQPRSRAQKSELDNKKLSLHSVSSSANKRRASVDTKVFDEAPWTVEPCS